MEERLAAHVSVRHAHRFHSCTEGDLNQTDNCPAKILMLASANREPRTAMRTKWRVSTVQVRFLMHRNNPQWPKSPPSSRVRATKHIWHSAMDWKGGEVLKQISESIADQSHASGLLHRLVFSLDVYRLVEWADLVVANLNGRVPDEGTIVECALAWQANKPLVYFKDDWRAPFHGRDNLMLTCLTKGQITTSIEALPISIVHAVNAFATGAKSTDVALGRTLAECRQRISFESSISFQKLAIFRRTKRVKLENC